MLTASLYVRLRCFIVLVCLFLCLQSWIREHFVCVDQDKLLYHFLVEGTVVKDGSKVQCDVSAVDLLQVKEVSF